jgi:hypothetical protein
MENFPMKPEKKREYEERLRRVINRHPASPVHRTESPLPEGLPTDDPSKAVSSTKAKPKWVSGVTLSHPEEDQRHLDDK